MEIEEIKTIFLPAACMETTNNEDFLNRLPICAILKEFWQKPMPKKVV
jgi:hypothetical protein